VFLMYEETASCSRSGIQVFVAAPDGCIDVPVVELERYITDCVSEVPDDKDGVKTRECGDGVDVEELTSVVLDSWEEDECGCWAVFDNYVKYLVSCESGVGEGERLNGY